MDISVDVHKVGGIIIKDRKLLAVRSKDKTVFNTPGGKFKKGETTSQVLTRELLEEVCIIVKEADLHFFSTFYGTVTDHPNKTFRMDIFVVEKWVGTVRPNNEIDEVKWVQTSQSASAPLSPALREILPRLKSEGLID